MKSSAEVELKLQIDQSALAALLDSPIFAAEKPSTHGQLSTYFDTPNHKLKRAGLSLRIRRIGDRRIQTVKAESPETASLFARAEWEQDVAGDTPEIDAITDALSHVLSHHAKLAPVFVTDVERSKVILIEKGSRIELVADRGEIVAGGRVAAISEIELELLEGDPAALFMAARRIARTTPLRLGVRSKSERGYALLKGTGKGSTKAEPVRLGEEARVGDAFSAIAGSCIRQFRSNEDDVLITGAIEAVHQARVALRRLRSALSIFAPLLAGPEHDRFRTDLKWISALLGDVRNVDVLIGRLDDTAAIGKLNAARKRRLTRLRKALDSARMRALMIDLAAWISVGGWRGDAAVADLRDRPAILFAHDLLDRLRRRIRKRGRHLATLDEDERHRVRILGKKLRYAAEFFTALYPGKKAGRRREHFLDALERLQGALGDLNDLSSGRALLAAIGIADGDILLADRHDQQRLLARAEDSLDRLIDGKRFWR